MRTFIRCALLAALAAAVLPLGSAAVGSTGSLSITKDTILTEDHRGTISIDADSVTLDCAGHRVVGSGYDLATGVGDFAGVSLRGRSGVTVKGCTITGFKVGVIAWGSDGLTVTGTIATGNASEGFVLADGTSKSSLVNDIASANGWAGFSVYGAANGNRVADNISTGNGDGFAVAGSSGTLFEGNSARDSKNNGFGLWNGATDTIVRDNVSSVSGTGPTPGSEFAIVGASGNTLVGNRASGAVKHNGFYLGDGASGNTLRENVASGNAISGSRSTEQARPATSSPATRARPTGSTGSSSATAPRNTFQSNTVTANPTQGFAVTEAGAGNRFVANVATGNGVGYQLVRTSGATLERNVARASAGLGFEVVAGGENTVSQNTASGSGASGFAISGSSENAVTGNVAIANREQGISLRLAYANTVAGNRADDNGGEGIALDQGSWENVVSGNTARRDGNAFGIHQSNDNVLSRNVGSDSGHGLWVDPRAGNASPGTRSSGTTRASSS